MDIKALESVLAVHQFESFYEAAFQTNFSLSAISKHVAQVEKELDVVLFSRKTKASKMELTPEGQLLLPGIEKIVMEYENLQWNAKSLKEDVSGSLHIGYVPLVSSIGEREIIAAFLAENNNVELTQSIMYQKNLVRLLYSGKMDGIFVLLSGKYDGNREMREAIADSIYSTIPIRTSKDLWLGMSDRMDYEAGAEVDLKELKDETFIFSAAQNPNYFPNCIYQIADLMKVEEKELNMKYIDFCTPEIILNLVAQGVGVLPQLFLPLQPYPGVKFVKAKDWSIESTGFFLYRKNNSSKALRDFCRCVKKFARQLSDVEK